MNENLPVKQNNSIFGKIKNFFRSLFYKEKKEDIQNKTVLNSEIIDKNKNQFQNSIKIEVNNDFMKDKKREELLDKIEENPEMLNDMSTEKLLKLESYYLESIAKLQKSTASDNWYVL